MGRRETRNPSILAHYLRWSMSTGRPVRVTEFSGIQTVSPVYRLIVDGTRDTRRPDGREDRQKSTLIIWLEKDDRRVALDDVRDVERPRDAREAA